MAVMPGSSPRSSPSGMVPRTVDAPGGPLVVYESADPNSDLDLAIATGGPTPYGRVLWASAPAVARVLASLDLAGKRVLELGCGTGLVSLVAARHGARVLATDVDDGALAAVARAARDAHLEVDTAIFDVRSSDVLPAADIVVAADVLYEAPLAAAVARRVIEARARNSRVVVGDPGRVFRSVFAKLVDERGIAASFRAAEGDVGVVVI